MTSHTRRAVVAGAIAIAAAVVARVAVADDCTLGGSGELGVPLVEHSCFHTTHGPFAVVAATVGTAPGPGTPDVDEVHTHYRVELTAGEPNVVTYAPVRDGTWAAFGDLVTEQRVLDGAGVELAPLFTQAIDACPGIPTVQVFALAAFHRYTIVFGPSPATETIIVLEKVSDFDTVYGRDGDGDGVGASADAVTTPCVPPAGYVEQTGDCDDADPAIYPGAAETCDGGDQDCDGGVDEDACTLTGGGGCAAGEVPGGATLLAVLVAALAARSRDRRGRRRIAAALIVVAGLAAPARAEVCADLGPALVDHTCLHGRFGPFKAVNAAPDTTDDLDAVHTYHRVALTSDGERWRGELPYTPVRSGDWTVFASYAVPIAVSSAAGELAWSARDDAIECPFYAVALTAPLIAGETYRVVIGPTAASEVGIAFEHVDDFVAYAGRDDDGDGYGDPDDGVVTACAVPAGHAGNDEDCDDGDAAVSPAAAERCDAADQNCNGSGDDVGDRCTTGTGACATAGTSACPAADALAVCDAVAAAPAAERCDAVDADCDAVADDAEPGLCPDPNAPRCVPDGRGARFCGCERDADCGAPDSGRLCRLDGAIQTCVDGCVDGFGRNACPTGERCSSTDPAAPGTCVAGDPAPAGCGCAGGGSASGWPVAVVAWLALRLRRRRGLAIATAGSSSSHS
jgi:uncharacterized protein (TIGR03382 family)